MSKSSFIIGLGLSFILHGLCLLSPHCFEFNKVAQSLPEQRAKLTLPPLPPPTEPTPVPDPPDPPTPEPEVTPVPMPEEISPSPPVEQLQEVVETASNKTTSEEAGDVNQEKTDTVLPELRLVWDNPAQLVEIARLLNLRILLVGKDHQPLGELRLSGDLSVKPFSGKLSHYSNRVRTLAPGFFGADLLQQVKRPVLCYWILVPSHTDQQWIAAQKKALATKALMPSQVSYMEARIIPGAAGHQLSFHHIAERLGRSGQSEGDLL